MLVYLMLLVLMHLEDVCRMSYHPDISLVMFEICFQVLEHSNAGSIIIVLNKSKRTSRVHCFIVHVKVKDVHRSYNIQQKLSTVRTTF